MGKSLSLRVAIGAICAASLALGGCGEQSSIPGVQNATASTTTTGAPPPPDISEVNRLVSSLGATKDGAAVRLGTSVTEKAPTEKAPFINGWNTFQVAYCIGTNLFGQDYLAVYMRDGTFIVTPNPISISVLAPACVASTSVAVWVTSTNGVQALWSHALTYRN